MSEDLVSRLRAVAAAEDVYGSAEAALCRVAANEVERLRAELADKAACERYGYAPSPLRAEGGE